MPLIKKKKTSSKSKSKVEDKKPEPAPIHETPTPAPKPSAPIMSTVYWAKLKNCQASTNGALIKNNIKGDKLMTEKEFDSMINKFRNSRTY